MLKRKARVARAVFTGTIVSAFAAQAQAQDQDRHRAGPKRLRRA